MRRISKTRSKRVTTGMRMRQRVIRLNLQPRLRYGYYIWRISSPHGGPSSYTCTSGPLARQNRLLAALYRMDIVRWRFGLAVVASAGLLLAQSEGKPSERLLGPYGLSHFSLLFQQAVDAFFTAYPVYRHGDFATASRVLDDFWRQHPAGSQEWAAAQGEGERAARTIGVEYGDPPCYSVLRMLT